jgi:drug/metabolite transporter (DMT)-like permease
MLDRFARLLHVSTTVTAIILLVAAVQLATQVYALVDLARRDEVFGGRKWVWALIIVLGNLLGAIGYLVGGRLVPAVDISGSSASTAGGEAARRAVDALYGPRDGR